MLSPTQRDSVGSSWAPSYCWVVTFAEGVLRLVRVGVRIDRETDPDYSVSGYAEAAAPTLGAEADTATEAAMALPAAESDAELATRLLDEAGLEESAADAEPYLQAGFSDIEAAVGLVQAGVATRVVLAGFQSWPGLLWRAYQLAEATDVLILPTVVRPGGKVDIVITRNIPANG
jgi:hypothetical protein